MRGNAKLAYSVSDVLEIISRRVAEKVLGKGIRMRALTDEVTLQRKNLNEIAVTHELVTSKVQVTNAAVRLRKGPLKHW